MLEAVATYIDENVFQSKVWDNATDVSRKKAVNTAKRSLTRILPEIYPDPEAIPVEHIAEQSIWIMKIDDTLQRAELGATSMSVDGFSISIKEKDRSIAPFILQANNLTPDAYTGGVNRRKVGGYTTGLTDQYRGIRRYPYVRPPKNNARLY